MSDLLLIYIYCCYFNRLGELSSKQVYILIILSCTYINISHTVCTPHPQEVYKNSNGNNREETRKGKGSRSKKRNLIFNSDFCAFLKITSKSLKYLMVRLSFTGGCSVCLFPGWTASSLGQTQMLPAKLAHLLKEKGH